VKVLLIILSLLTPFENLDWAVQRSVQASRSETGTKVMRTVSKAGRPRIVLGVLLGVAVFGGPAGVLTARYAVFALIPTNLAVEGLKRTFNRTRPDGERNRNNASFPSSHAANAFAIAMVLAWRWRRLAIAFWFLAALVAASRVYLDRHFLSDVTVGAAIGLLSAWLVFRIVEPRAPKARKTPAH